MASTLTVSTFKHLTLIPTLIKKPQLFSNPHYIGAYCDYQFKLKSLSLKYRSTTRLRQNRKQCNISLISIWKTSACCQFTIFKRMKVRPSHYHFPHYVTTALKAPHISSAKSNLDCELLQKLNMALEFLNKFLRKHT